MGRKQRLSLNIMKGIRKEKGMFFSFASILFISVPTYHLKIILSSSAMYLFGEILESKNKRVTNITSALFDMFLDLSPRLKE